mgnify:CR=1 FL=1
MAGRWLQVSETIACRPGVTVIHFFPVNARGEVERLPGGSDHSIYSHDSLPPGSILG